MERLTALQSLHEKILKDKFAEKVTEEEILTLSKLKNKLESGELIELPCEVGDTVYVVGIFDCQGRHITDKELKRKIFDTCMDRNGQCDGCEYSLPSIEEFVCTNIQIDHDGIWVCGAKEEMHLASKVFTDKEAAKARLKELQEKANG